MKYHLDLSETDVFSSLKVRGDFDRAIDLALFGTDDTVYDFFPFDDYLKFIEGSKVLWSLATETPNKSLAGFGVVFFLINTHQLIRKPLSIWSMKIENFLI